ncbi:MAG: prepilin-type N-terminal cleavage/methylation domain-containing protein [Alphaproteobacteria bacterium]|nr:prepilin-type N-terminal cleavage/methylation domain-containing protein [Alphaproteobacteria bacterium]
MIFAHNKTRHSEDGFTLIELAIVMIIAGMVMLIGADLIRVNLYEARFERTIENIGETEGAMNEFFAIYGRYPCPADPSLVPADPNYGLELCRVDPDNDPCPPGIFCTTQDGRDANGDDDPDPVMIGMIPVRTLLAVDAAGNPIGIVDSDFLEVNIYDGFDTRLTYAVSEYMTNQGFSLTNPANESFGAISVVDENNISLTQPPGSAHFVIVSHGDNQRGGYIRSGDQVPSCLYAVNIGDPEGPAAPGLDTSNAPREIENCDYNDAIFRQGIRSLVDGFNYNDDILYYEAQGLRNLWVRSFAPQGAGELFITNTNISNVGVGITDPAERLHVANEISAQNGVIGEAYCLPGVNVIGDVDCMLAESIAGNQSSMRCPPGQVAYAVGDDDNGADGDINEIFCRPVFDAPPAGQSCPTGEYITGLRFSMGTGTTIICGPL